MGFRPMCCSLRLHLLTTATTDPTFPRPLTRQPPRASPPCCDNNAAARTLRLTPRLVQLSFVVAPEAYASPPFTCISRHSLLARVHCVFLVIHYHQRAPFPKNYPANQIHITLKYAPKDLVLTLHVLFRAAPPCMFFVRFLCFHQFRSPIRFSS
ncbi:hypothetical protein C8J57DRAFT_716764 [Mycena rebaudengoi]|nr:hypothetical protein C8J57DRAFT_716764 [Mycena rebaudengoi]